VVVGHWDPLAVHSKVKVKVNIKVIISPQCTVRVYTDYGVHMNHRLAALQLN
jgi:hypothetical protein